MWIVKNESSAPLILPELRIEIAAKEYLDLDAHGRERAEAAESVSAALTRGTFRTISKQVPETAETPKSRPVSASGLLRDLVDRPPLSTDASLLATPGPPASSVEEAVPVGIREAFRRASQRKGRRTGEAEEAPGSPEAAALRQELEHFRRRLLDDIQKLLEDYLRP
jgi:hypothetical protein